MKRWYAVQTKAYQEALAYQELRNQNFSVYYPTYMEERKRTKDGSIFYKEFPLFPSYMFVQFDVKRNKRWRSIQYTRGVQALVGCTETYLSPLPKGCIEEIMARTGATGHVNLETAVAQLLEFTPNMKLIINRDAFAGHEATYCKHSGNRVTLLMTLLNRPVRLILPIDAVSPAPTSGDRR